MVPLSTWHIFAEVVRSRIRVVKLSRWPCMRARASQRGNFPKFAKSHLIWNHSSSIRLAKLGVMEWSAEVYRVTWGQSSTVALLCYVQAMELFSGWSKNGINETAKMPKIGSIFRHKISYLEKYSNNRVPRSNRTWCYKCLTPPIIGHTGELTILPNESTRNFNLRQ